MNSKMSEMVDFIRDNGIKRLGKEMVSVFSSGLMVQSMKVCGRKTKPMVKVE